MTSPSASPAAPIIDAHAHLPLDAPAGNALLEQRGMKVLNICVDTHELGGLKTQQSWYRALRQRSPASFAWCTSFSLSGFGGAKWAEQSLASLAADCDNADGAGAIACKVWKNVGMELRDPATGDWVMVDDHRFTPIFDWLTQHRRPLLMHIGEPMACWRPLDPASPHFGYYKSNPQWHWHGRSDVPTHESLMAARDRVVARHPNLPIIGAHFGSHEYDLAEVARRFERYPNYFVDTSARLGDVALHTRADSQAVRDFFIRFADRILWGVDWVLTRPLSAQPQADQSKTLAALADRYDLEHCFYATDEQLPILGHPVRGLALPPDLLDRLRRQNAIAVYRGL